MKNDFSNEINCKTIVALSTSLPSAIAIIRLSGKESLAALKSIFRSKQKEIIANVTNYGRIDINGIKDNVLAVYYKAPKSYTGEDMVEIFCHGSKPVVNAIINELVDKGCCLARGGEFSLRAYLNGKLDLSACEGIVSLINAQTDKQAKAAYGLLDGQLKAKIDRFQKRLIEVIALIDADLDYPEEGVAKDNICLIRKSIDGLKDDIALLKETYNQGRLIKDGVKVVLAGNVNVGKSSIINALLNKERVIVSSRAGTTTDVVEDSYVYKGIRFVLTDTAGIRKTTDIIEMCGVDRALREIERADIVLSVRTQNEPHIEMKTNKNTIFVKNKIDLEEKGQKILDKEIRVSALKSINIDALKEEIFKVAFEKEDDVVEEVITDLRHYNCLDLCLKNLSLAFEEVGDESCCMMDCVSALLKGAYESLGEITGVIGSEPIIEEIFSKFCVGK